MHDVTGLKKRFEALTPFMDERIRRLWAGAEATALGWGGVTAVAAVTGISRTTIAAGMREHEVDRPTEEGAERRIRRHGGGRTSVTTQDPTVLRDLDKLVDPLTRGDPQSPLRWTCKSTRKLAEELQAQGHAIGERTVAHVLRGLNYSLQATRKTTEGASHPDRNAQFAHINQQTTAFQERTQPVVSVDTKKKELVSDFRNGGQEWQPKGEPVAVRVHDFVDKDLGKAIPYGVYDVTANTGWVSVGTDHDTAEFAVETVRRWWRQMGRVAYPRASDLLLLADGGGSNGVHARLWKTELQRLATEIGLRISVCHLPPGTSKWNKIEHRMFAHITQNWRGRPLVSHEVAVNVIGSTTTQTGLQIRAELDRNQDVTGRKITDAELGTVQIECDPFHGEWNYTIVPKELVN